jgi:crotonobetaine/carnitine-CoA ligase
MPSSQETLRHQVHPFAGRDVPWLLAYQAAQKPDHTFLIWEPFNGGRQTWTYAQFHTRVLRVAAGLVTRGVKPGDKIMVHLDNSPELEFLWFACQQIGAVVVTTNTRSAGPEIAYFAEAAGAVGVITQPELAALVAQSVATVASVQWLVVTEHTVDGADAPANTLPERAERFSKLDGDANTLPALAANPMRPGSVQFTSGTTSRPKPVLWTHGNALWGARQSAIHQNLQAGEVHQVVLPSFHTNARTYSILPTMWVGGSIVLQPRFSASRFWDVAVRNKSSWHSTVPFCLKALSQQPVPDKHYFRMWGTSANELPFDQLFRIRSIGWWGMTETITQGIVGDVHLRNPTMTIGRPAPAYGIRILNEDRKPVRGGETGHLECYGTRGLQLFAEYMGMADKTRESFTDDGWFITGDRVTLRDDGVIVFADRDKDMLKVGGENVAASEVERVILTVPGVRECAVIGQKHRMLDEVPVVFVIATVDVTAEAVPALQARITTACKVALADFKVPRAVHVVADMPRATLEKINKAALRATLPELS